MPTSSLSRAGCARHVTSRDQELPAYPLKKHLASRGNIEDEESMILTDDGDAFIESQHACRTNSDEEHLSGAGSGGNWLIFAWSAHESCG